MPATATQHRFLTPEEVATELFGDAITPRKIVEFSKTQGMPSHLVGRRRVFLAEEVAAWVRSREGGTWDRFHRNDVAAAQPAAVSANTAPSAAVAVDPAWVAAQVAKFDAEALRRAGELLLALANSARQDGAA